MSAASVTSAADSTRGSMMPFSRPAPTQCDRIFHPIARVRVASRDAVFEIERNRIGIVAPRLGYLIGIGGRHHEIRASN
jgi:hypothetical protein